MRSGDKAEFVPSLWCGREGAGHLNKGAGDHVLMFGHACSEAPDLMPPPIYYAHRMVEFTTDLAQPPSAHKIEHKDAHRGLLLQFAHLAIAKRYVDLRVKI